MEHEEWLRLSKGFYVDWASDRCPVEPLVAQGHSARWLRLIEYRQETATSTVDKLAWSGIKSVLLHQKPKQQPPKNLPKIADSAVTAPRSREQHLQWVKRCVEKVEAAKASKPSAAAAKPTASIKSQQTENAQPLARRSSTPAHRKLTATSDSQADDADMMKAAAEAAEAAEEAERLTSLSMNGRTDRNQSHAQGHSHTIASSQSENQTATRLRELLADKQSLLQESIQLRQKLEQKTDELLASKREHARTRQELSQWKTKAEMAEARLRQRASEEREERGYGHGRGRARQQEQHQEQPPEGHSMFVTAAEQLEKNDQLRGRKRPSTGSSHLASKRAAGLSRPGKPKSGSTFVNPHRGQTNGDGGAALQRKSSKTSDGKEDESYLASLEEALVDRIKQEVMLKDPGVTWDDIAGLAKVKKMINEVLIWPMQRPDMFTGLRSMPKGVLMFGPPGTGKTMIAKAIASQMNSTFFSISASTLTSKWIGEGEKLVRALFAFARESQPAIIFIDEIDSLLQSRSDTEHESSRRIKTEFLVQLDGATTSKDEQLLILGATNRPQELDEAARRRLARRLYIPLPDFEGRKALISKLLGTVPSSVSEPELVEVSQKTQGFSGADIEQLCKEAAMYPVREQGMNIQNLRAEDLRPISSQDLVLAMGTIRSSVSASEITAYENFNKQFGTQ